MENREGNRKAYELLLFDLDGTLYSGNQIIREAPQLILKAKEHGQKIAYVTNNSTKTPEQVVEHLKRFGIEANPTEVITSSLATAFYLKRRRAEQIYLIGEEGLKQAIEGAGCQVINSHSFDYHLLSHHPALKSCQYVVVGLDREITYQKLACATIAINHGAGFIATNIDKALPTEHGLLPGNGSLVSVIQTATGIKPVVIGKPEQLMVEYIDEVFKVKRSSMLMIGDNYETDIMLGINGQIDTALVYSGFSKPEDIKELIQPTYQWENLSQFERDVSFYSSNSSSSSCLRASE